MLVSCCNVPGYKALRFSHAERARSGAVGNLEPENGVALQLIRGHRCQH